MKNTSKFLKTNVNNSLNFVKKCLAKLLYYVHKSLQQASSAALFKTAVAADTRMIEKKKNSCCSLIFTIYLAVGLSSLLFVMEIANCC